MKISFIHKLLLVSFSWLLVCPMNAEPVASNELYATYQKHGDRFYEGGGEANLEATYHDWAVNYYIVSCGDSVLLRATTTETNNLENGWPTQLRVWTGAYNNGNEIQVNAGDNKNRYTSVCRTINASAADVNIHLFLNWSGNCTTEAFSFNRSSINNPIVDNVAPVIDPTEVTMEEVDTKLVFTFGDVTADDEYFYYVGDKDHNIGGISLGNKVYITKPTVEDGTTYKFRCYAVDYNGNKSEYKEFTLAMPFDENLDLAFEKPCIAGYSNGGDTPDRAVNGANNHWGTYGISDYSLNWWRVDLGNAYDISEIDIEFETSNTYKIESSLDDVNWTEILREDVAPATSTLIEHTSIAASARYVRLTALGNSMVAIRHFKVYASGLAVADATNPTVSASCTASTINSATLRIIAADEDDAGNAGTINSIKVSDITNGFAEQEVLGSLVGNEVTLNGLTYNTTYNFTITVSDLAGNTASTTVEVVLPFNDNLDIARGKSCTAGAVQNDNTPDRAVNGNENNFWTCFGQGESSNWWWSVDLENAYYVTEIKIHFNDVWGAYSIYHSLDGVDWIPVVENETANNNETKTYSPLAFAGRFLKVVSAVSQIGIKEFEVYASGFASADATNPTVSASCTASTINSATLQIIAADEDDAGNAGTINSIKVSDITNGFAEQEVLGSLVGNEVTLNGLTYNTTYNFTITVSDLAGNTASTTVEVVLPFNTELDLAFEKPCEAGISQGANTPDRAVNGNPDNFWTSFAQGESSDWWWSVDLGDAYNITEVKIHFNDVWGAYSIYHSLDGVDWIPVAENETATNDGTKTYSLLAFAGRYFKVVSAVSQIGIKEFEVYGSGFAPISLNETDNSALLAAYDDAQVDVALSRSFVADGYWYTLCLPFDMSAAQLTAAFGAGYTLATLTGSEDRGSLIHLNFDNATTIVAGKPYLFKPGTNVAAGTTIENVTIKNIAPSVDGDELMHFQGTFNATTLTGSNVRFVGDDDYLYSPADGGTNMGAFRCYFTIPSGSSAGMPGKRARIIFGEQTATGISDVQSDQVQSTKVLRDGQLFIIRDGRTYNAQGMLVK